MVITDIGFKKPMKFYGVYDSSFIWIQWNDICHWKFVTEQVRIQQLARVENIIQ